MNTVILDEIPFQIDLGELSARLHVERDSADGAKVRALAEGAAIIARPKSAHKPAYVESRKNGSVIIDGFRFSSRVLRVNLAQVNRVFAFIATCGVELYEWSRAVDDMMEQYWASEIMETALRAAYRELEKYISAHYRPGASSIMSPGSLEDWPMEEQRPLFDLLGEGSKAIGVQLTPSFLMIPTKSLSGILFPTEIHFESCQICSRKICPHRRAPYDKDLYASKYGR